MPSSNNDRDPWFLRLMRPPTTENKDFTPMTEVGIIVMQGLALIGLLAISGALAHAALLAWDMNVTEVRVVGWGAGLVILMLWLHDRLVDTEVGKALAVLLGSTLGYSAAVYALADLLLLQPGLDVEIVSALIIVAALLLILVLGTAMVFGKHYKAAAWFVSIVAGGAAVTWWLVPTWAATSLWPWSLSGLSLCTAYGAYWTGRALKTEIDDPQKRGMTGLDRAILTWVGNEWLNGAEQEDTPWRQPIIMNGKEIKRLTDEERERDDFERFVLAAWEDSTFDSLRHNWGYSRTAVTRWRDWLIGQQLAKLDEPGRKNSTWGLLYPPSVIMDVFVWPEVEE